MSKWKCEICNSSFENFDARGFDNKIYCPLCYYKKLYKDTELERERLNKRIKELEEGFKASTEDLCETTEMLEETKKVIDEIERYFKEDYYYCNHPKMIYKNDLFKKIKYLKRKIRKLC